MNYNSFTPNTVADPAPLNENFAMTDAAITAAQADIATAQSDINALDTRIDAIADPPHWYTIYANEFKPTNPVYGLSLSGSQFIWRTTMKPTGKKAYLEAVATQYSNPASSNVRVSLDPVTGGGSSYMTMQITKNGVNRQEINASISNGTEVIVTLSVDSVTFGYYAINGIRIVVE